MHWIYICASVKSIYPSSRSKEPDSPVSNAGGAGGKARGSAAAQPPGRVVLGVRVTQPHRAGAAGVPPLPCLEPDSDTSRVLETAHSLSAHSLSPIPPSCQQQQYCAWTRGTGPTTGRAARPQEDALIDADSS